MTPALQRSGAVSAALHLAVLFALILTLKPPAPPPVEETAVTMEFAVENAQVQRAQTVAPPPPPPPPPAPPHDPPPRPAPAGAAAPRPARAAPAATAAAAAAPARAGRGPDPVAA